MAKNVSIFDGTQWVSIVGPPGKDGVDGKDGSGVTIKGTANVYPPDASPTVGDMWLTGDPVPAGAPAGTNPGDGLVWTGTEWNNVGGIRGPKGADGADGADGAPGQDGAPGADGAPGVDGTVAIRVDDPAVSAATEGLLSIETDRSRAVIGTGPDGNDVRDSTRVLIATGGVWYDLTPGSGPAGADGQPGADGAPGADGRSVNVTKGPTQPATAAIGDFWIEE